MSSRNEMTERFAPRARAPGTRPLTASVAHEINNPLDSLLNLLYLLGAEAALSEKARAYLALAQEEVRRISQIARATLDEHQVVLMPERQNVGELLGAVVNFYKPRLNTSGITVQTRDTSDSKILVYPGPLRQLFSNLLLNAVDAMPTGGTIQARVSHAHEWSGNQRQGIRVTVADDGSGIASTLLPHMFERHFTTKPAGHGMGLSLVKDIVDKHKGSLRVRSSTQPNRHGTVFSLFLPAA